MKSLQYRYPVSRLFTGSSFGNRFTFAQLDECTNVLGLWSSTDNQFYLGEWKVEIQVNGQVLTPTETFFRPESQTTVLRNEHFSAEVRFFLPFSVEGSSENERVLRAGILLVVLNNGAYERANVIVRHAMVFPAVPSDKFTKKPPEDQRNKSVHVVRRGRDLEITTTGNAREARMFRANTVPVKETFDDCFLATEYAFSLAPDAVREEPFVFAFSPDGVGQARETLESCADAGRVLAWTLGQMETLLSRTALFTPEPVINRAMQWAKVNTARVQHTYRIGDGFTNDPPQDIIVIRDLGWYLLGSDYITPAFSRRLLELAEKFAFHSDGKLTEFIRANEEHPDLHDYNLNINDDTPLYVYGLYHHAVTCGDAGFLNHAYPLMKRACGYILSQVQDGLVRCDAGGTNVWGICSWRNIIDDYNLTGAVTEINVECAYALQLSAIVAAKLGFEEDAKNYAEASRNLKHTINTVLVSEKTKLYLLNLDKNNIPHHDVTGDLIFPVLFDVADAAMRQRILERLTGTEFWTPYGTRTVSPVEENYDPDFGYQLVGGVWPNLTAWTAYCIRKEEPEKLVEGMMNTYRLSETEIPKDFVNVVPGEFPERLHGETFVSRGMTMSPWMPPTFVWLGVEGLMGVMPTIKGLEITPAVPHGWTWIGVRNLLYKGEEVDAFLFEGILYATREVQSRYPTKVGTRMLVSSTNPDIFTLGLEHGGRMIVFAAAAETATGTVTVNHAGKSMEQEVVLKAGEAKCITLSSETIQRAEAAQSK